jgi:hypothetical protein
MEKLITEAYVIAAGRANPRRKQKFIHGRRLDIGKSRTVICAALRVYILVR